MASGDEDLADLFAYLGEETVADFDFERWYTDEENILRPALAARGFTNVRFSDGERDSFGPLSRIVTAVDAEGNCRRFVYG